MTSILRPLRLTTTHFTPRSAFTAKFQSTPTGYLSTTSRFKMPERLTKEEATTTDPSVTKQYDAETPVAEQWKDFYSIADSSKVAMLGTYRSGVGPVARSMGVAKRTGPDFLFLTNANSQKIKDLSANKEVSLTFHNSSSQDWISVTGEAATTSNSDPRIKEIYSKAMSAWFGNLGDGKHDGGPDDPRLTLIEVQPKYIVYWKKESSTLGFVKEVGGAVLTGGVANPGALRELKADQIKEARASDSAMSS